MDLHDNNYPSMVNLLIQLTCGSNNLRVEAPEWCPTTEKIGNNEQDTESDKVAQDYCKCNVGESVKVGK